VLWNKPERQATVTAEISDATLQALTAILDPAQDGYHDTNDDQPEPIGHLTNTPRCGRESHSLTWSPAADVVRGIAGVEVVGGEGCWGRAESLYSNRPAEGRGW
jgi:hypothetical protein